MHPSWCLQITEAADIWCCSHRVCGRALTDADWQRNSPWSLSQETQQQAEQEQAIFRHRWRAAKPRGFRTDRGRSREYRPCLERRAGREIWLYKTHSTITEAMLSALRTAFSGQIFRNFPSKPNTGYKLRLQMFPHGKDWTGCCGDKWQLPVLPCLMLLTLKWGGVSCLPKNQVRIH